LDYLAGFYGSSQKVERSEFREFTRQFLQKNSDIYSLQWLPLVRDQERAAYEALARKDGLADFQINEERGREHRVRAPRRQEYFPVHFIRVMKSDWALIWLLIPQSLKL